MALAKLAEQHEGSSQKSTGGQTTCPSPQYMRATRLKIYLAGGFQSGWQDRIMKALPSFDYFDPRSHGLATKAEYTAWDLEAIRRSDYVFAYFESTNPGGYALALEVGFAKALGKFVIFVDEKSTVDAQMGRYLEMVSETADVSFKTLQEGVAFLEKFNILA
jgi:nucleoside 2-deoxyribosyltransferase